MKNSMNYLKFFLLLAAFSASFSFGVWFDGIDEMFLNRPVWGDSLSSSDDGDVFISSEEQEHLDLEGMRVHQEEMRRQRLQMYWRRTVSSANVSASLLHQGLTTSSTPLIRSSPRSVFHTLGQRQEGPRMDREEQAPKKQPRLKFIEYPPVPRTHEKWEDYPGVELTTRGAGTVSETDPLFEFMDKGWLRRCHDRWIIKRSTTLSALEDAYYFDDVIKPALKVLWSETPLKRKTFRAIRARIKGAVHSEFLRMLHLLAGRKRVVPGTVVELDGIDSAIGEWR